MLEKLIRKTKKPKTIHTNNSREKLADPDFKNPGDAKRLYLLLNIYGKHDISTKILKKSNKLTKILLE
tara:strand:- start:341 stop:544 length:204 start_codon:yes stop_codon:yes gene_type:complete